MRWEDKHMRGIQRWEGERNGKGRLEWEGVRGGNETWEGDTEVGKEDRGGKGRHK